MLDFYQEYCKGTTWSKITFSQKEGEWIKIYVFAATDIDIQDELNLLSRLHKKYKLANISFEDHFIIFKAHFEGIYVEDTFVFQCKKHFKCLARSYKFALNFLER